MKKKAPLIILVCCLFLFTTIPIQSLSAEAKTSPHVSHTAEYEKWDITVVKKIYYHDGVRIRIFQDIKSDNSFEKSFVDVKGTVDIRLLRNDKGTITKLQYISKKEADEILEDFIDKDESNEVLKDTLNNVSNTSLNAIDKKLFTQTAKEKKNKDKTGELTDIIRCKISEVPSNIQKAISNCTGKGFYVIEGNGRQYVYYNHLSKDYAFQSKNTILNIIDIGSKTGIYVLLSLPDDVSFRLSYNSNQIGYTRIVA
ncbi:hypothetical protein [Anaerocolumna jejuensis]|uniref:hypothetical protein n=1 Tax=Anaerocolumna jejuensis TaxID=259063 RepID=UPI003F7B88EC